MGKVLVIGGGAAGMLAAVKAKESGHEVHLFEKNDRLGKKLYITGKGRCNLTNACDMETLLAAIVTNPKFLYSSLYSFNNFDTIDYFEGLGLNTKIERGMRVFPVSDKSSDVISVLLTKLNQLNVNIHYNYEVTDIVLLDNQQKGIKIKHEEDVFKGDYIVIATGGLSYPSTGSTGDGYRFAKEMGHTVKKLIPSLVPLNINEPFIKELQGLSLKNIQIHIYCGQKEIYQEFGELLFTHFGVSGPIILSASSFIIPYKDNKDLRLTIDFKPALTKEQLDARLIRDFELYKNKQFKNSLEDLFPKKIIPVMVRQSNINTDKKVNEITKEERQKLVSLIKEFPLTIDGFRGFNEAVITHGGIDIKEINPKTMESKLVKNVFFIGEVLDVDGLTGGFNLQIAWSTAHACAKAINKAFADS